MDQKPKADLEQHLEMNRQAAQELADSVKECCQAAERHLNPQEPCQEDEAPSNLS